MIRFSWWHWLILVLGLWELLVWVLRTRFQTQIRINANPVSGSWQLTPLLWQKTHTNETDDKDDLRVAPRKIKSWALSWDVLCLHVNITHTWQTEEGSGPMRGRDVKPNVTKSHERRRKNKHTPRVEQPRVTEDALNPFTPSAAKETIP